MARRRPKKRQKSYLRKCTPPRGRLTRANVARYARCRGWTFEGAMRHIRSARAEAAINRRVRARKRRERQGA